MREQTPPPGDHAFLSPDPYGLKSEPTYSGALSFMRRPYTRDLAGVDVAVTGVPLDTATTNRPGARFGPRGVREASTNISWCRPYNWDFHPFDEIAVVDYGDCYFNFAEPGTIADAITGHFREILAGGAASLAIGGDHFVSYPILRAYAEKYGPLSLLHFDAHSDTWDLDVGRLHHGNMFYHAAKEGLVDPALSVQVGLRTHNEETHGFHILDAPWVHAHAPEVTVEAIKGVLEDRPVYFTFDIDCLDPSFAPGTGTPVFGGLTSAQIMTILRGLAGINLVGMDVVEVAPPYDHAGVTALAGATIGFEMLALFAHRRRSMKP